MRKYLHGNIVSGQEANQSAGINICVRSQLFPLAWNRVGLSADRRTDFGPGQHTWLALCLQPRSHSRRFPVT